MVVQRIYDLIVVHLFKCIFHLGPCAVYMLQAQSRLNPALTLTTDFQTCGTFATSLLMLLFTQYKTTCFSALSSHCHMRQNTYYRNLK